MERTSQDGWLAPLPDLFYVESLGSFVANLSALQRGGRAQCLTRRESPDSS